MSKHAALDTFGRSGNPVIRSSAFDTRASSDSERMTLDGAVNKTAIMLAILVTTAAISWNFPSPFMVMISYIVFLLQQFRVWLLLVFGCLLLAS